MLVWINGPFGVGKTHVAAALARRVPDAFVADPELLGHAIHRMLPPEARHDYQDRPQWRTGAVATLIDAVEAHDGVVLVPMTLTNPDYFQEIVGGLRDRDIELAHVTLMASPAAVRRRIRGREGHAFAALLGRTDTWALDRVDPCLRALDSERFAEHVDTDGKTIDDVTEEIAARLDLELARPRQRAVQREVGRIVTTLRHVRW